jgi:hypothetical protein
MSAITGHPLIRALTGLNLPTDDYVVFGSGPMLAHGLRTQLGDLDVVARGAAWQALTRYFPPTVAPSGHGQMVRLVIEVADRWLPGFDTDHLIATAEHHDGIPFAPLSAVRASKRATARAKDWPDLALIDTALAIDPHTATQLAALAVTG